MSWTPEARRQAALTAPIGSHLLRPDSRVIERPGWYQIITPSAPVPSANEVVMASFDADADPDAAVDAVIAGYDALGLPLKWCVHPWSRPADLGERLSRRGFEAWEVRAMARATDVTLAPAPGVTAERVDPTTVEGYIEVMVEGWEMVPADASFYADHMRRVAAAGDASGSQLYLARVDGTPAGCAGTILKAQRSRTATSSAPSSCRASAGGGPTARSSPPASPRCARPGSRSRRRTRATTPRPRCSSASASRRNSATRSIAATARDGAGRRQRAASSTRP
jgi:hypothetical protein